jgi:hypothetical protein
MTMSRRWALPLVLVGAVAIGAALGLRRRNTHHDTKKRQHTEDLRAWEGEGGSLAAPAAAQQPS